MARATRVGAAAQRLVLDHLLPDSISCFWHALWDELATRLAPAPDTLATAPGFQLLSHVSNISDLCHNGTVLCSDRPTAVHWRTYGEPSAAVARFQRVVASEQRRRQL